MSEENGGTLRAVAWSEMCPWLNIFRVFRIAIGFRVLALATAGLLLMILLWGLVVGILGPDPKSMGDADVDTAEWMYRYFEDQCLVVTDSVPENPGLPQCPFTGADSPDVAGAPAPIVVDSVVTVWLQLTEPLRRVLTASPRELLCLFFLGMTSLAIWSFFGGAITRIAAVELACEERIPLAAALRHACSKFWGYFTAPLVPLLGIALLAIPIWILGLIMNANVGVLLISFFWLLALLSGFVMTLFLVGLLFGWPLMWATVSTEGTDSFDALSRSYAYVFQRPLHFLFYTLVAIVLGALGWLLVWEFTACIIQLTYWSASWGCGVDRIEEIQGLSDAGALPGVGGVGFAILNFWVHCLKFVAGSFIYGFFFVAASAIYLLLRRDVDATEMDEVYLDEDAAEETYGLPPLDANQTGAPEKEASEEAEPPKEESTEGEQAEESKEEEPEAPAEDAKEGDTPDEDKPSEEG